MTYPEQSPVRRFFGFALASVGGLIMTLCGLCTGFFMIAGLAPGGDGFLPMAIVIGGIPTAVGVGMFLFGRRLLRRAPRATANRPDAP